MFPSHILLGLLERAELNLWTIHVIFTTAAETPETRLTRRGGGGLIEKYAVKFVLMQAQMWKYDKNGSENLCQKSNQQIKSTNTMV
jgi:hypothetical protein